MSIALRGTMTAACGRDAQRRAARRNDMVFNWMTSVFLRVTIFSIKGHVFLGISRSRSRFSSFVNFREISIFNLLVESLIA